MNPVDRLVSILIAVLGVFAAAVTLYVTVLAFRNPQLREGLLEPLSQQPTSTPERTVVTKEVEVTREVAIEVTRVVGEKVRETVVIPQTVVVEQTVSVPQTVVVTVTPEPVIATATPSSPTATPTASVQLPFSDNFDDVPDPAWIKSGGDYGMSNGRLVNRGQAGWFWLGQQTWQDVAVEAE